MKLRKRHKVKCSLINPLWYLIHFWNIQLKCTLKEGVTQYILCRRKVRWWRNILTEKLCKLKGLNIKLVIVVQQCKSPEASCWYKPGRSSNRWRDSSRVQTHHKTTRKSLWRRLWDDTKVQTVSNAVHPKKAATSNITVYFSEQNQVACGHRSMWNSDSMCARY